MFEFLKDLAVEDAVAAAYLAVRRVTHRHDFRGGSDARILAIKSEPTMRQQKLGDRLIHEIVAVEKKDLADLPLKTAR